MTDYLTLCAKVKSSKRETSVQHFVWTHFHDNPCFTFLLIILCLSRFQQEQCRNLVTLRTLTFASTRGRLVLKIPLSLKLNPSLTMLFCQGVLTVSLNPFVSWLLIHQVISPLILWATPLASKLQHSIQDGLDQGTAVKVSCSSYCLDGMNSLYLIHYSFSSIKVCG